jgi:hypothetical protein
MATGIVSVAMHSLSHETLSRALTALMAIAWALLAAVFVYRARVDQRRWRCDGQRVASLTSVAGTAVLGVRLTLLGWWWAGWTLLALATALGAWMAATVGAARSVRSPGRSSDPRLDRTVASD